MSYTYRPVDRATLEQAEREAMVRPEPSHMGDKRLYTTHAPVISWAVNGDDLVEQSNYLAVTTYLAGLAGSEDQMVIDATMNDWAVGPMRQTFVQVRDDAGVFTHVWRESVAIALYLRDTYPVFDEADYVALEFSVWTKQVDEAMAEATYEYADLDGAAHAVLQTLAIGDLQTVGEVDYHACPEQDVLLDAYRAARDTYYGDMAHAHFVAQIDGQGVLAL